MVQILTDNDVTDAVLGIIKDAKSHAVLVSPYNDFWGYLRDELSLAVKRGVRVTFVYRADKHKDDIDWLGTLGITVYAVDTLHAKIYFNESTLLLTSMNLLESSAKNSKEIALRIESAATSQEVREYVKRLQQLGRQLYPKPVLAGVSAGASRSPQPQAPPARQRHPVQAPSPLGQVPDALRVAATGGKCIRCRRQVDYDTSRPLCDECYGSWSRYQNPEYEEFYCHRCGREADTSYAKPLCRPCFGAVR